MPTYQGLGSYIAVGKSDTYAGQATSMSGWIEAKPNTDGLTVSVDEVATENLTYITQTEAGTQAGRVRVNGNVAFEVPFGASGQAPWTLFVENICSHTGNVDMSGTGSGVWEPQNSLSDITGSSLTIEQYKGEDSASFNWVGCWVNQWDINVSENSYVEFSFGILGRTSGDNTKTTPNFNFWGAPEFMYLPNAYFDVDTFVTWGGSSPGQVNSLSMSISRPLAENFNLGSRFMNEPYLDSQMEITANMEVDFENRTLFNNFIEFAGNDLAIEINGSSNKKMRWLLRNAKLTDGGTPTVDGYGKVKYNVTFKALSDPSSSEQPFQFMLVNGT